MSSRARPDPPRLPSSPSRRSVAFGSAFVFLTVLTVHLLSPNVVSADSLRSVFVGVSVLRDGDLDIQNFSPSWTMGSRFGIVEEDGDWLPYFPWAPSLFAVPALFAADGWLRLTGRGRIEALLTEPQSAWAFELVSMSIVVAVTAVVVYLLARVRLPALPERRRNAVAVLVALVFALGTSAWSTSSRSLWQHGPAMLFVFVALFAACLIAREDRAPSRMTAVVLGASAAAAFTMRPTSALLIVALGCWLLVSHRQLIGWVVLGGLPVASLFVAVNLSQYGAVLPVYFVPGRADETVFAGDVVVALAGNLVSPARGLFVFTPVLLLAVVTVWLRVVQRRLDGLEVACLALVVVHWWQVSTFPHWWGGYSYGPRFMSDAVPPLLLLCLPAVAWLAAPRPEFHGRGAVTVGRVVAAALVLTSVVAHGQGALFRSSWCWNSSPVAVDENVDRLWDWSDAQVTAGIRGWRANGWDVETERAGAVTIGCGDLSR